VHDAATPVVHRRHKRAVRQPSRLPHARGPLRAMVCHLLLSVFGFRVLSRCDPKRPARETAKAVCLRVSVSAAHASRGENGRALAAVSTSRVLPIGEWEVSGRLPRTGTPRLRSRSALADEPGWVGRIRVVELELESLRTRPGVRLAARPDNPRPATSDRGGIRRGAGRYTTGAQKVCCGKGGLR
jgi:hypothetical protein